MTARKVGHNQVVTVAKSAGRKTERIRGAKRIYAQQRLGHADAKERWVPVEARWLGGSDGKAPSLSNHPAARLLGGRA